MNWMGTECGRIIGESPAWRRALTQATQMASTNTTILLLGESGTGKEVVARLIHRVSSRRDGPFVALNCAALPEELLDAELFGDERCVHGRDAAGQLQQAPVVTITTRQGGAKSVRPPVTAPRP
jgi:transcriptional regulator with PAS, ATPase and Fis domain